MPSRFSVGTLQVIGSRMKTIRSRLKKKVFYPTNYNSHFQMHPFTANNSKNLPELKRLLLSVSITYDGRKESGPSKCHLIYMLQNESKLFYDTLIWVRNSASPQGKLLARRMGPILSPKHYLYILTPDDR